MILTICYTLLYVFGQTDPSKQCRRKCGVSSGSTMFATHPAILDTTVGSKLYMFKFSIKYVQELRCLNTKCKYGKVTDTEIKWSIISKSVMIIIFKEFYRSIDCPINCASLKKWTGSSFRRGIVRSYAVPILRVNTAVSDKQTWANSVDPDLIRCLIRVYTVCHLSSSLYTHR